MKKVKLFSILATVVTIVTAIISLTIPYRNVKITSSTIKLPVRSDSISYILKDIEELSIQSSTDTVAKKELSFLMDDLQNEIKEYDKFLTSTEISSVKKEEGFTTPRFMLKVIFSAIFCFAALYVVLSKKYDDETKKWAFSVLTLIAGVWIGTVS